MIVRLLLMLGVVLLLPGCGKKSEASVPPASPQAQAPDHAAPPETAPSVPTASTPATAPMVASAAGDPSAVLGALTQSLRKYYFEHHQVPKNFEDFARSGAAQVPQPPAGKKFAIDTKRLEVVLVNP